MVHRARAGDVGRSWKKIRRPRLPRLFLGRREKKAAGKVTSAIGLLPAFRLKGDLIYFPPRSKHHIGIFPSRWRGGLRTLEKGPCGHYAGPKGNLKVSPGAPGSRTPLITRIVRQKRVKAGTDPHGPTARCAEPEESRLRRRSGPAEPRTPEPENRKTELAKPGKSERTRKPKGFLQVQLLICPTLLLSSPAMPHDSPVSGV